MIRTDTRSCIFALILEVRMLNSYSMSFIPVLTLSPLHCRGAGTDANVFIAMYGALGSIGQNPLETHGVRRAVWGQVSAGAGQPDQRV